MTTAKTLRENYRSSSIRYQLLISVIVLAIVLYFYANFLNYVEVRVGFSFRDPVLELMKPIDLTLLIFISIYLALFAGIIILIGNPLRLVFAVQIYTLLVLVRIIAMYSVPLNPPADMIPLNDPFVQFFGTGKLLTKDLFFSGHTATLFMLYLVIDRNPYKKIFLLLTIVVAVSVLLQHVHYFIDVFTAPFFAFACYEVVKKTRLKINYTSPV